MEREDIETMRFLQETGGTCGLVPLSGPSFRVGREHHPIIRDGFEYRGPVRPAARDVHGRRVGPRMGKR